MECAKRSHFLKCAQMPRPTHSWKVELLALLLALCAWPKFAYIHQDKASLLHAWLDADTRLRQKTAVPDNCNLQRGFCPTLSKCEGHALHPLQDARVRIHPSPTNPFMNHDTNLL